MEEDVRRQRADRYRWEQVCIDRISPRTPANCSAMRRYLNKEQFVNAIAPKGDLSKIGRNQFGTLFRVADVNKRELVSWDDFVVFETILKRPDADYWIAFQYFDVYVLAYLPPFTIITP